MKGKNRDEEEFLIAVLALLFAPVISKRKAWEASPAE